MWVGLHNHRRILALIGAPVEAEAGYHSHVGDQALPT